MLLGDSTVLAADKRVAVYSSIDSMEDDGFTPNMPEYKAAQIYFSQSSNPNKVAIGYWDSANESLAEAIAACRTYNLEWWGCVPLGKTNTQTTAAVYELTANGLTFSMTPTPDTNFRIQFGGNAAASVNVSMGANVPTNDEEFASLLSDTSFTLGGKIYTAAVSGSSVTYTADETGSATPIGKAISVFWIPSTGSEVPIDISGYTAKFTNGGDAGAFVPPAADELLEAALTVESATPNSVMVCTSFDIDTLGTLKSMNYRRTLGIYTPDTNKAVAILGWAMGANTRLANSAFTLKFKRLAGVSVDPLTEAQVSDAAAVNANVYINRGATYDMFEQGTMADGTWFDEMINLDMLSNYIQLSVMDLLTKTAKVPQTEAGVSQIINAFKPELDMAVRTGFAAPGIWTAPGFLELETGDAIEDGYLVLHEAIDDQSAADREARICPPIYVALKLAGAIHSVVIQINVNR
jgi:hypothetical protein